MDKKAYREYWKIVRVNAKNKASNSLGILGRFLALFVTTISAMVVSIVAGGSVTNSIIVALVTGLIWLIIWSLTFIYYYSHEPIILEKENREKIKTLEFQLESIENNKKVPRLVVEPKPNDSGTKFNLEIKNKNSKDIMDCKAKLRKVAVFHQDGTKENRFEENQGPLHLRWNDKNLINLENPWPSGSILEKSISSYQDESLELIQIKQLGWAERNFIIEVHSHEGDIQIISSEETEANYAQIEIGIALELIFDFEDETKTFFYAKRIRFAKYISPKEENGKIIYQPAQHKFKVYDWEDENNT